MTSAVAVENPPQAPEEFEAQHEAQTNEEVLFDFDMGSHAMRMTTNGDYTQLTHTIRAPSTQETPVEYEDYRLYAALKEELKEAKSTFDLVGSGPLGNITQLLGYSYTLRRGESGGTVTELTIPSADRVNVVLAQHPELFSVEQVEHRAGVVDGDVYSSYLESKEMPLGTETLALLIHDRVTHIGWLFMSPLVTDLLSARAQELSDQAEDPEQATAARSDQNAMTYQVDLYTQTLHVRCLAKLLRDRIKDPEAVTPERELEFLSSAGIELTPELADAVGEDLKRHTRALRDFGESLAEHAVAA